MDQNINGVRIPEFIYGTAWKEERTSALTLKALQAGFTGIDTANQRKHYFEAGVGEALHTFCQSSGQSRSDIYLQSKFTYAAGQDNRLPYDPSGSYRTQVQQSFDSSLKHLGTDYLDAYILHGPSQQEGLGAADIEVWQAMEELYQAGKTKLLGVSNISSEQLSLLIQKADIKPALVQNRCYASTGWDKTVRTLCQNHDIQYQGFSLLTANPGVLQSPYIAEVCHRTKLSIAQVVLQASLRMGITALTGTTSGQHMREDLECAKVSLTPEEIRQIETLLI